MGIASLCFLVSSLTFAAPATSKYTLITSAGPIGGLTVVESGSTIELDWKVDDNGRGPKLKEHVELGKDGLPRTWELEGTSEAGAPVKERFVVEGARAKWTSLDDSGEGEAKGALYLPNHSSPWAIGLYLKVLLATKDKQHAALPGGVLRLEKVRELQVGKAKEKLTAYALWGMDVVPTFLLGRKDHLVAVLWPGFVFSEEKVQGDFGELSALATELSGAVLKTLTARLTHPIAGPLWLNNVRVFDSATGKVGSATRVGIYRERVVALGEPAPPDAAQIDCGGGTLLPGLMDSHAHMTDWSGPLDIAAGVTFGRDPGNDTQVLLKLQQDLAAGTLMGPRIKPSGFLEGKSEFSAKGDFVIETLEDGMSKVRWYADHGYWGIKIYNSMNPDFVKPLAEEAHRLGLHVSGHVPAFMSSERAVRDGYDEINHINQLLLSFIIDPLKEDTRTPFRFTALGERMAKLDLKSEPVRKMIALMKERKTVLDPTMATFNVLLMSRPGKAAPADLAWLGHLPVAIIRGRNSAMLDVKPELYATYDASWKKLEEALVLLDKEGIQLVPGTDDVAGFVLHAELEAWVKAGIPASRVLTLATAGGAKFLGMDREVGTIAKGMLADLYLVDGDPTVEIGAIDRGRLVLKDGNLYFPDEIHEALGIKPFATRVTVTPPAP